MNVPPVLDRFGVEEEIIWHLTQIENGLLKEGKLSTEYVGVPLPEIKVSWRQSKQGKGRTKEERALSLNLLGTTYQQNGCPVCTVEVAEGSWKRLGPLWEIFHTGLSRRALGRKCLMVVMYNGKETNNDRVTMQRLRRVNVIYMDSLAHLVIPNIACVHKRVEVQMEDNSTPRHKFTDLSREFMFLSVTNKEGKVIPMFDVIMPYVNGMLAGSAVVTYRHDNIEAAILIKKIRQSVASWWYGYWSYVVKYKQGMIKKLMESFDIDAARLAAYSQFDVETLTVIADIPDVDGRLDDLEAELGIDQWTADIEMGDGIQMSFTGHKEAVSKTLRDRPDDIFDADRSGPSRRTDFTHSTGNSTNNSDASIRNHKRREKALKTIDLVDKNYSLEAKVHEAEKQFAASQAQIASVLAEFNLYKSQHTKHRGNIDKDKVSHSTSNEEIDSIESSEEEEEHSDSSRDTDNGMEEDGPSLIRGGSDLRTLYAQDKFNLCREISVLEGSSRPRVPINILLPEHYGKLPLTIAPPSSLSTTSTQGFVSSHQGIPCTPTSTISDITMHFLQPGQLHYSTSPPSPQNQESSPRKSDDRYSSGRGAFP
jgi:hypothetical protein